MASFEPFVSSDPFSMSTFNSKLGGAFGKVDADEKTNADAISEVQNAMAGLGNCDIGVFSYVGNGEYGASHPTTITFPKMPTGFFMWGGESYLAVEGNSTNNIVMIYYTGSTTYVSQVLTASWNGNQFQFYHDSRPIYQMNSNGVPYWGLAFYQKS